MLLLLGFVVGACCGLGLHRRERALVVTATMWFGYVLLQGARVGIPPAAQEPGVWVLLALLLAASCAGTWAGMTLRQRRRLLR